MTQGDTIEEALSMAHEGIELMLEDKYPAQYLKPFEPENVAIIGTQFIKIVEFEM